MIKNKPHKCPTIAEKILILVLLFPIFLILSMNLVMSAEFDNSKSIIDVGKGQALTIGNKELAYNSLWEKYKPIEIKNWYGLGETLMTGAITKHTSQCANDCSSEMQIYIANDGVLIDDVKFYTIEYETINEYGNVCIDKLNPNGDIVSKDCKNRVISSYEKEKERYEQSIRNYKIYIKKSNSWQEYNIGEITQAGNYEVKIDGNKRPDRVVDWQIISQGKIIDDWAVWGEFVLSFDTSASGNGNPLGVAVNGSVIAVTDDIDNTIYIYDMNGNYIKNWATEGTNTEPTGITQNGSNWFVSDGSATNQRIYKYDINGNFLSKSGTIVIGGSPASEYHGLTTNNTYFWVTRTGNHDYYYLDMAYTPIFGYSSAPLYTNIWGIAINGSVCDSCSLFYTNLTQNVNKIEGTATFKTQATNTQASGIDIYGGYFYVTDDGTDKVYKYYNNAKLTTTTLNSPVNYYNSTSNSITFNCSSTVQGGATIKNISLWLNITGTWILNETQDFTGTGGTTNYSIFTKNIPDGVNNQWTCRGFDTDGVSAWATNRSFSIDTTYSTIVINKPTSLLGYGLIGGSENLSWSITDLHFANVWYNYNGTNITIYGNTNSTTFTLGVSPFNLTLYANDTFGNTNSSYVSWSYTLFGNSVSYSSSTLATSNESFGININYDSSNWISANAYLNYNGTNYLSTKTATTNNLIFNNSLIVPNPSTSTSYNFFWNISLTNATGTYYIPTTTYTQTVNSLQSINITSSACSAGFSSAFNFTSLIESNLTAIDFTTVSYNLQYGSSGNSSALVSYGTFANVPSFNICINTTSSYWVGYGEIQYQVSGYSNRRFYIFQNTRLLNTTISNNLYSLDTASSTPFQITATNTALTPYNGYYIALLRWYPDLNQYKVVEMGKTDAQGQTVLNVKTNDVDYRLALYTPDGILVKMLNPIRMVCQTTPCIYSLIVDLTETDLTTFLNIQSSLTYDATAKEFIYIFNDPSQDTTLMNLTVWKDYPDRDSEIICTTSANSFTGILVCDVSAYTGELRAEVWRSASPKMLIAQLLESIRSTLIDTANGKFIGLFIGFILLISMALMGAVSPPLVIILGVVALIPLVFLGVIDKAIFLIIGAIGGIILHFLRRIT